MRVGDIAIGLLPERGSAKMALVLSEEEISLALSYLSSQINNTYKDKELVLVGVLRGAFIFMADLARRLNMPLEIDFAEISSYGNDTKPGEVKIIKEPRGPLTNKHVLIVDVVIDSGKTVETLESLCWAAGAASVAVCALLIKADPLSYLFPIDFYHRWIRSDAFVYGYGTDLEGKYRNLTRIFTK